MTTLTRTRGFAPRFHWFMAVWITFAVLFGFGQEVDGYFIHPTMQRPAILVVHSILATAWLALYLAQTTLISAHARATHRRMGLAGMVLGVALIGVSVPTALAMNRFDVAVGIAPNYSFVIVPLSDMVLFTVFFAVGMARRMRPDWHRPAMFMAMLTLADAGFGRWPRWLASPEQMSVVLWITGAVALIHDWRTRGRISPMLAMGLAGLVVANINATILFTHPPRGGKRPRAR
jgi:hypothetical protein